MVLAPEASQLEGRCAAIETHVNPDTPATEAVSQLEGRCAAIETGLANMLTKQMVATMFARGPVHIIARLGGAVLCAADVVVFLGARAGGQARTTEALALQLRDLREQHALLALQPLDHGL